MHDYAMLTVCIQQGAEYVFVMKNLVNIILSLFEVTRKNILYNHHGIYHPIVNAYCTVSSVARA